MCPSLLRRDIFGGCWGLQMIMLSHHNRWSDLSTQALWMSSLCLIDGVRGAFKLKEMIKVGNLDKQGGGGLTELQVFIDFYQNQIRLVYDMPRNLMKRTRVNVFAPFYFVILVYSSAVLVCCVYVGSSNHDARAFVAGETSVL